jgi:hypothetical protein
MGWRTVADVRDHSRASGSIYMVALMLAERAPDESRVARPGLAKLAEDSRCSRSTVQRALKWLITNGEIKPVAFQEGGRGRATEYLVLVGMKGCHPDALPEKGPDSKRVSSEARKGVTGDTPTEEEPNEGGSVEGSKDPSTSPCQIVFSAWIESTGRTGRTILSEKRRKLIRAALKDYPAEDLIDAVRGWRHSPHHRGDNDRQTVYNDIETLLRDSKQIELFRDLERGNGRRRPDNYLARLAEK